jgi:hypothetical protein
MKKYVALMCCTILAACTESVDLSSINKESTITNRNAEALMAGVEPVGSYQWTKLPTTQPDLDGLLYTSGPVPYVIGQTVFVKAGHHRRQLFRLNNSKTAWEHIISGPLKEAFNECTDLHWQDYLFSYGSKFYFYDQTYNTFTSVNVTNGAREALAPFPGEKRTGKMSFVIGTKGYVMGGKWYGPNYDFRPVNDRWEYDFAANQWTYKGLVLGGHRSEGIVAVLGDKLYVGLGHRVTSDGDEEWRNDWLEYDFSTPGPPRVLTQFPAAPYSVLWPGGQPFTVNDKIYLQETGVLWEYDPTTNRWSEKDCPSHALSFFSLGNAGYMIKDELKELWRYSSTSLVPTNP